MKRTTIVVPMKTNNVNGVLQIIATILEPLGYKKNNTIGENVWTKGDAVIIKMQCIGASFTEDSVVIQGWLRDEITGESALEGFVAMPLKKKTRGYLDQIQQTILLHNY